MEHLLVVIANEGRTVSGLRRSPSNCHRLNRASTIFNHRWNSSIPGVRDQTARYPTANSLYLRVRDIPYVIPLSNLA